MTEHAIARAKERYSVNLTFDDLRQLEQQILDKASVCMNSRLSPGAELHMVKHDATVLAAVFMRMDRVITTFLPRDCFHGAQPEHLRKKPQKRKRKKHIRGGRRFKGQRKSGLSEI